MAVQERYLDIDARWMLRAVRDEPATTLDRGWIVDAVLADHYAFDANVRTIRSAITGRMLVARATTPPELLWLEGDAADVASLLGNASNGLDSDLMLIRLVGLWGIGRDAARPRMTHALQAMSELTTTSR